MEWWVLTFEGLQNNEAIQSYYDGGLGGMGSGPGPNYGITFGGDSLALIDFDDGGSGNFGNEPSPSTTAYFVSGPGDIMNVPAGFTTGFSFFYTSVSFDGTVTVYDGLNGTGNVLASLALPSLGVGPGDPNGAFSNWAAVGVSFSGMAKSANFSGVADQIGFDDINAGLCHTGSGGSAAGCRRDGLGSVGRCRRRQASTTPGVVQAPPAFERSQGDGEGDARSK